MHAEALLVDDQRTDSAHGCIGGTADPAPSGRAAATGSQPLSIYDFDRTLTLAPTYSAFLLFAARRLAPWRLLMLPLLVPHAIGYAAKRVDRNAMKAAMHRIALGQLVRPTAEKVAQAYAEHVRDNNLSQAALRQIAAEKAEGRRIVLATAAPRLYAEPLARLIGIDDVIATQDGWAGDVLLPAISGRNCYGGEKLARIRGWLSEQGVERSATHIRFYSDHISDLPSFEFCDEAVVVNPCRRLQAVAAERRWPVLDWRTPTQSRLA